MLYLWFPLLLSVKCLHSPEDHAFLEKARFLLHYWLWYLILSHAQWCYSSLSLPLPSVLDVFCGCVKIWLLYGHGCLVLSYFYLPKFAKSVFSSTNIQSVEHKYLNPAAVSFVAKNPLVQGVIHVLLRIELLSFASGVFEFNSEIKRTVSHDTFPGILTLGLHCLCFVDHPSQLVKRYRLISQYLSAFSSASQSPSSRRPSPKSIPPMSTSLSPRAPVAMNKKVRTRYTDILAQELLKDPSQPRSVSDNFIERKHRPRSSSTGSGDLPYPLQAEVPYPTGL